MNQKIRLVTWNIENMFNPKTGGPRNDHSEFEGWTLERYEKKLDRIGNVMNQIMNDYGNHDEAFIWGLTEIESSEVVDDLLKRVNRGNLKLANDNEFPHEYFDTAILYDSTKFELVDCRSRQTFWRFPKGDVTHATLRVKTSSELLEVFCCHLKARPANKYYTATYRQAVCDNLQTLIWKMHGGEEVLKENQKIKDPSISKITSYKRSPHVILMGDFNDEPFSPSMMEYLCATYDKSYVISQSNMDKISLYNASWEGFDSDKPGSYYYEAGMPHKWNMLDQIIISPSLVRPDSIMSYDRLSFKVLFDYTTDENKKPIRTSFYDENDNHVWQDGWSDHLPVTIRLTLK